MVPLREARFRAQREKRPGALDVGPEWLATGGRGEGEGGGRMKDRLAVSSQPAPVDGGQPGPARSQLAAEDDGTGQCPAESFPPEGDNLGDPFFGRLLFGVANQDRHALPRGEEVAEQEAPEKSCRPGQQNASVRRHDSGPSDVEGRLIPAWERKHPRDCIRSSFGWQERLSGRERRRGSWGHLPLAFRTRIEFAKGQLQPVGQVFCRSVVSAGKRRPHSILKEKTP